jgi:IclR family transcriptional regulator, KDG regulon repressor
MAWRPIDYRRPSNSLERALSILEMISQKSGGLTNAEISRRIHIATSSCCYVLSRLEQAGYVVRSRESGRYEIALKLLALGHSALKRTGFRSAYPILYGLASQTHFSILIAVLERGRIMLVEKIERPDMMPFDLSVGMRAPAHATALGKVLLARLSDAQLNELIEQTGLPKISPRTITSRSRLSEELDVVRKRRYAESDAELYQGVYAVAAPIVNEQGQVCAAVSVTGCSSRILSDHNVISALHVAGRQISNCAVFGGNSRADQPLSTP